MRVLAGAATCCVTLLLAGCWGGDGDEDEPAPTLAVPTASPTATAVPTAPPTPDPYAKLPTDHVEARGYLQKILGPSSYDPPCPPRLKEAGLGCAQADADGDGKPELAYLVPVIAPSVKADYPAAVFIRGGNSQKLEEFAFDLSADASIIGLALFAFADRTGDAKADLTYLRTTCGPSGCRTRAVILSWDGTTFRDIGSPQEVASVDSVTWEGTGAESKLKIHGGKLPLSAPAESGPSRASTTTFEYKAPGYGVLSVASDPPEYLFQAIEDADALFERDKAASIEAYRAAIANNALKDWSPKTGEADRRPLLVGYALWRIALATAVTGNDPTAALDDVFNKGKAELFWNIAREFRRGYLENQGLLGGCTEVNGYLRTPQPGFDTPVEYVKEHFNYGLTNRGGEDWVDMICPY